MVKSVDKALQLLMKIKKQGGEATIGFLSKDSGLPPSTVHRLLSTLKKHGFIDKDENSDLYSLGPTLLILGFSVKAHLDLRHLARPILKKLTNETGEDSYITVAQGKSGIFLDSVPGPHPLKVIESFGDQIPLHCGAMRKVLLAYKDNEFIKTYLQRPLEKYTNNTITDRKKLLLELKTIRETGLALSFEEYTESSAGVASPVRNKDGNVIAAIGIIGPVIRFNRKKLPYLEKYVKDRGLELSNMLGYNPDLVKINGKE